MRPDGWGGWESSRRDRQPRPIATYDGTPFDGCIQSDTNPWVEVAGVPVDWTARDQSTWTVCPCEDMGSTPLAGVIAPMDTPEGVQRCDACGAFDGDLDAALALARTVGGVVRFHIEPRR